MLKPPKKKVNRTKVGLLLLAFLEANCQPAMFWAFPELHQAAAKCVDVRGGPVRQGGRAVKTFLERMCSVSRMHVDVCLEIVAGCVCCVVCCFVSSTLPVVPAQTKMIAWFPPDRRPIAALASRWSRVAVLEAQGPCVRGAWLRQAPGPEAPGSGKSPAFHAVP